MLKLLTSVYGNRVGQAVLESIVRKCFRYMGIGTGDDVFTSGESGVIKKVLELKTPPYCIFDAGSHQGQYLGVLLSILGGEDFTIHCFEPSPRLFGTLSAKTVGDRRVVLNNFGLGKITGQAELFFNSAEAGGTLTRRHLEHIGIDHWQSERVMIDTVDGYCAEHGVDYIHLLKADIEGHEMDLLLGARQMFEKRAIRMATFEFGGCNIDTRTFYKDFFYFFKDNGMDVYRITPAGYLHPLPDYREIDEQYRTTNFAAIDNRK
jgi:FkbM family methyltransferase